MFSYVFMVKVQPKMRLSNGRGFKWIKHGSVSHDLVGGAISILKNMSQWEG